MSGSAGLDSKQLLHYVEEFGLFFEQFGLPRSAGRILGWLLVCTPPHQTMDDLAEALQVSKSSISTSSRILIQSGLVDRISLPGERRDFYRISTEAWSRAWAERQKQTAVLRQMAERGLNLLADAPPSRRQRLQEMHDLYAFLENELPQLMVRWRELRQKKRSMVDGSADY